MGRWLIGIIVTSFLVLSLVLFFTLYQFAGLKYYFKAITSINSLAGETKTKARQDFYGKGANDVYQGILGGSWKNKILMWGRFGPRLFTTDEFSVYSFFDICKSTSPNGLEKIGRTIFTDINKWGKVVKRGDYAMVMLTKEGKGGKMGNLREIYIYNW